MTLRRNTCNLEGSMPRYVARKHCRAVLDLCKHSGADHWVYGLGCDGEEEQ